MPETIGIFGATGNTGSHFVKLALDEGYTVKALARTPDKITTQHDKLQVIQGSFTDEPAVKQVIEGSDYVVCMAGHYAKKGSPYPKDLMLNLVKLSVPLMETSGTRVFLYQSGAMANDKDGNNPFMLKVLKHTLARILGIFPTVADNEAVTRYLASDECKGVNYIITRPGSLKEMESSGKEVKLAEKSDPATPIAYVDLAQCSLKALKDESVYGKNLFVAQEK